MTYRTPGIRLVAARPGAAPWCVGLAGPYGARIPTKPPPSVRRGWEEERIYAPMWSAYGDHLLRSVTTPSALVALDEPGSREVGRSPLDES